MIELVKAMVKHCGGVPLAIVVLGGLLTTKDKLVEWKKVSKNIGYDLGKGKSQGGIPIIDILALSYQDLPYHLKMWMAEGIVLPSSIPTRVGEVEEETMFDVGMSYLGELVHRCMVQVQLTRFNKKIKLCHLHDLMRDLCLLKAKEENFLETVHIKAFGHQLMWVDPALLSSSSLTTIRRFAVYYLGDRDANSIENGNIIPLFGNEMKNHHHIRSCQFYSFGNELESSGWQKLKLLFKGLTLITVLDLERIIASGKGKKFPRAIGNLIYLRYLSIRESDTITSLPSSIGNLGFLQTLDLRRWSISSLRIPNLAGTNKLRLDSLNKLETLEYFDTEYCDVRCLSKLTNLQKFSGEVAPEDLAISGDFETEEEQSLLKQLLGCHHLRQLSLWGYLNLVDKLPDQFPPNLTYLHMGNTELEEDPMPTLEKLPNLRSLILDWNSYIGKEMVCSSAPTTPSSSSKCFP
ncbi:unnamed protein product [Camellia sinensis]